MLSKLFKNITNKTLDLLFPNHCIICGNILFSDKKSPKTLCINCIKTKLDYVHTSNYEFCDKCGNVLDNKNDVCKCIEKLLYFDKAKSMLFYNDKTAKLIHSIKFSHRYFLCADLGFLLINFYKDYILKHDVIIPIPLGKLRLKTRGYNQSELIAKVISKKLNIKMYNNIVYRKKETKALSASHSVKERETIITSAFNIDKKYLNELENKNILIIDDVLTTGTTVNEISKELKLKVNCKSVNILTIAKVH